MTPIGTAGYRHPTIPSYALTYASHTELHYYFLLYNLFRFVLFIIFIIILDLVFSCCYITELLHFIKYYLGLVQFYVELFSFHATLISIKSKQSLHLPLVGKTDCPSPNSSHWLNQCRNVRLVLKFVHFLGNQHVPVLLIGYTVVTYKYMYI